MVRYKVTYMVGGMLTGCDYQTTEIINSDKMMSREEIAKYLGVSEENITHVGWLSKYE